MRGNGGITKGVLVSKGRKRTTGRGREAELSGEDSGGVVGGGGTGWRCRRSDKERVAGSGGEGGGRGKGGGPTPGWEARKGVSQSKGKLGTARERRIQRTRELTGGWGEEKRLKD